MAYEGISFTKDWRNAQDFPTTEPDERKVREDMQFLFEEIKNYINDVLVKALNSNEGASNTLMRTGTSVQDAIDALNRQGTTVNGLDRVYVADTSEPDDTRLFWVDTSGQFRGDGPVVLKYYNEFNGAWEAVV